MSYVATPANTVAVYGQPTVFVGQPGVQYVQAQPTMMMVAPAGGAPGAPVFYTTGAPHAAAVPMTVAPPVAAPQTTVIEPTLSAPAPKPCFGLGKSRAIIAIMIIALLGMVLGAIIGSSVNGDDDDDAPIAPSASAAPIVETQSIRVEVSTELAGVSADTFNDNQVVQDSFKAAVAASMTGQGVSADDIEITGVEEVQVPVRVMRGRRAQQQFRTVLRIIFVIIVRVQPTAPVEDDTVSPPPMPNIETLVQTISATVSEGTFAEDMTYVFVEELKRAFEEETGQNVTIIDFTAITVVVQTVQTAVQADPSPTPTPSPGLTPSPSPSSAPSRRPPLPSRTPSTTPSITPSSSPTRAPSSSPTPSRSPTPSTSSTPSTTPSTTPSSTPPPTPSPSASSSPSSGPEPSADPLFFVY